jgi:rhamnosyltransferase subunit B
VFAEHYLPNLEAFYEAVAAIAADRTTVVVGAELGSFFAAEKFGLPFVSIACSPGTETSIRSRYDPVHPERTLPPWAAWLARTGAGLALLFRINNALHGTLKTLRGGGDTASPPIPEAAVRLRERIGLPREMRLRPDLFVCMWPEWFAHPQRDWPKQAVIAGFPLYPRPSPAGANASAGARPIVVTTGSVAGSQRDFYARALAACKALGREAFFVTPHKGDIPDGLPGTIRHLEHAPFNELFARAALVIHHGGIGTASYALAAGIPQIVMPMRGDQFDNGNRLSRLGIAEVLPPKATSPERLAHTASRLLGSRKVAQRCEYWKSRIDPDEGCRRAADWIERVAARRASQVEKR